NFPRPACHGSLREVLRKISQNAISNHTNVAQNFAPLRHVRLSRKISCADFMWIFALTAFELSI
ncbi:MAG: hypothetical protein K2G32_10015, partial [Oscillospiraceae bacterium]|nr:hypothetical protein [Oscillospiraceae bacterium]